MPYRVTLLPGDGIGRGSSRPRAGRILAEGRAVAPDLGGAAGTREMTDAIIGAL